MSALVDVGGYRLAYEARGDGTPPVVFVSGLGDTGDVWSETIAAMRVETRTVTYERPGLGDSDPLPVRRAQQARRYSEVASELRRLLHAAGNADPAVLVGHSIGAHVAIAFASQWPDESAGLVTVDATDPGLYIDIAESHETIRDGDDDHCASFDWVRGLREFETQQRPDVPAVVIASAVGRWATASEPELYRPFTLDQVDARWQAWQQRLAKELRAVHVVATRGGHYVHTDMPNLTASAIDATVHAIRERKRIERGAISGAVRAAQSSGFEELNR